MKIKLTPMMQYRIAFWSVTGLLFPFFFVIVLLGIINPFWFRNDMLSWIERLARKTAEWRDGLVYVKYYHDKAFLFDKLKA
jgi:hypothetical protein